MADQASIELITPSLERWEQGDFSRWDECFAPDLLLTGFDADGPHKARGPAEINDYLDRFFRQFRDYRIEVRELEPLSEGLLLMHGEQLGVGRLSGLEIRETLYIVFRFDAAQLSEMHWHPKKEGALEAAGLGEEPSGAS